MTEKRDTVKEESTTKLLQSNLQRSLKFALMSILQPPKNQLAEMMKDLACLLKMQNVTPPSLELPSKSTLLEKPQPSFISLEVPLAQPLLDIPLESTTTLFLILALSMLILPELLSTHSDGKLLALDSKFNRNN